MTSNTRATGEPGLREDRLSEPGTAVVDSPTAGRRRRNSPFAVVLLAVVRGYQRFLSPLLPARCRFYPSCSQYAVEALRTRGAAVGTVLAAYRLLRCNPWARGGVDHVPHRGERWPSWDGVIDRRSTDSPAGTPTP